jgi:hypothetical protein
MGYAFIELDLTDQKASIQKTPTMVVIGQKGDTALLGTATLKNGGLLVDPFRRTLRRMKLMLA